MRAKVIKYIIATYGEDKLEEILSILPSDIRIKDIEEYLEDYTGNPFFDMNTSDEEDLNERIIYPRQDRLPEGYSRALPEDLKD